MDHRELIEVLSARLLTRAELGDLGDLTMTFRANRNGGAHVPGCKSLTAKATAGQAMTIAEFRAGGTYFGTCRRCGGGQVPPLDPGQAEQVERLAALLESPVPRATPGRALVRGSL